jgi:hypothetical protein
VYRHEVDIYEGRSWVGGKVASFQDKDGNHIEVRKGVGAENGSSSSSNSRSSSSACPGQALDQIGW